MSHTVAVQAACLVAIMLVGLAGGCGKVTTAIEGTVTYRGQPLPNGTVAVFSAAGGVATGVIRAGVFAISGLPSGEAVVTVECDRPADPALRPPPGEKIISMENPALPQPSAPSVAIPTHYRDRSTSPFRVNLGGGLQQLELVLTDP